MTFAIPRLYAIIDAAQTVSHSPDSLAALLLEAGVRLVQYRDKAGSSRQIFETSVRIREQVHNVGGIFIVNDRPDIALVAAADGVHVGQDDLEVEWARRVLDFSRTAASRSRKLVGCSTHNLDQVIRAESTSADYIAFGPVYDTQSKSNHDPIVGLEGLRQARKITTKPLVAIGGITLETAPAVIEAGADSVAVISDLVRGPDLATRTRQFLRILR